MQYLITFLEGIITFISPCLLPMLPIYVSYFAGDGQSGLKKTILNAVGFIIGFTLVFLLLGALAGTLGSFLVRYQVWFNLVCGILMILFGISYLGLFRIPFLQGGTRKMNLQNLTFFRSILFGIIFSISWTPCVGTFLGSALLMASQQAHMLKGLVLLFAFSMGLGIPYFLSAILIDRLKGMFRWIREHYLWINRISGCFLILIGILMASGLLGWFLNLMSFI